MNSTLLLLTVGSVAEPIVASLLHWRPVRAVFIVSPEARSLVAKKIVPQVSAAGWADFDAGRYDLNHVSKAQDYTTMVAQLFNTKPAMRRGDQCA
jgi:hypothetical protein